MNPLTENFFLPVLLASRDAAILAVGIGGILLVFGGKIPAVWRHLIWLLVAVRLLLPVLPSSSLSWQVLFQDTAAFSLTATEPETRPSVVPAISSGDAVETPIRLTEVLPFAEFESPPQHPALPAAPASTPWGLLDMLAYLWAAGAAAMALASALLVYRFHRRLQRLTHQNHPRESDAVRLLVRLAHECGFPKAPQLLVTEAVSAPALTGWWKARILLPVRSLEKLDEEALRFVFLHELAHLRRRDLWTNWILAVLRMVHWFNPFVWWAFHRLRVEAERATDVWVLERSGADASVGYGEALLGLLELDSARPAQLPGVVGVLESSRDLHSRIVAIARFTGRRSRLAVTGAVLLLSCIAVVGLTQAPEGKVESAAAATVLDKEPRSDVENRTFTCLVRDEEGNPVSGAQVFFQPNHFPKMAVRYPSEVFTAITDAEGKALISLDVDKAQEKKVSGEWFARHESKGIAASGYRFADSTELTLRKGDAVSLKVVDENEVAIAGLSVRAVTLGNSDFTFNCNPSAELKDFWTATTDANGECVIEGLPEGTRIYVDHTDERYAQPEGRSHWKFQIQSGSTDKKVLKLEPAAAISGRIVDSNGKPVKDVKVRVLEQYGYARGGCSDDTTTDADGRYVLKRLLASSYDIGVTLPEVLRQAWAQSVLDGVSLKKGQKLIAPDIVLTAGALVTGRVTYPDTGKGVPNLTIGGTASASTSPLVQWWSTTDSEGNYVFRLSPGDRKIYIGGPLPTGYSRPKEREQKITLREGDQPTIDFVLQGSSRLTGRVVGEDGEPVAGVTVRFRNSDPHPGKWVTRQDGTFEIEGSDELHNGQLYAYLDDQFSTDYVTVEPGKTIELRLSKNGFGRAEGRVIDEAGNPIVGARVRWHGAAENEGRMVEVTTDSEGRFLAERLPAQNGAGFFADALGYGGISHHLDILGGKATTLPDFILPKASKAVSGKVVDAQGNPVGNTRVWVEGERQKENIIQTNGEGQFHFEGIVEGWLWVEAVKSSKRAKKRVRAGAEDVIIQLPESAKPWKLEEIFDFVGKPAPPLKVDHWFHVSNPDAEHRGKIRMIRFVGKDRPLTYHSGTVKVMQKLQDEFVGKDVEFLLVHGAWPREEVDEILKAEYPDLTVPLAIESERDAMSDVFGVQHWLTIVIDRDGKVVHQNQNGKGSRAAVEKLLNAE